MLSKKLFLCFGGLVTILFLGLILAFFLNPNYQSVAREYVVILIFFGVFLLGIFGFWEDRSPSGRLIKLLFGCLSLFFAFEAWAGAKTVIFNQYLEKEAILTDLKTIRATGSISAQTLTPPSIIYYLKFSFDFQNSPFSSKGYHVGNYNQTGIENRFRTYLGKKVIIRYGESVSYNFIQVKSLAGCLIYDSSDSQYRKEGINYCPIDLSGVSP